MSRHLKHAALASLLAAAGLYPVTADAEPVGAPVTEQADFPANVYWGDTHLHTNYSADAYGLGNKLTPDHAYRFARGEALRSNSGLDVQLGRPLDFLAVTDHAEYLGVTALLDGDPGRLADSEIGQRWLGFVADKQLIQILLDGQKASMGEQALGHDPMLASAAWRDIADAADRHNDPGTFTTFIGFEWSSLPGGNNLHRNVIFRDDGSRTRQVMPFSAIDSRDPRDLWRYLADYEQRTGGTALAIPHNGNMSNGLMFNDRTMDGTALSAEEARHRARYEPVVEVTQIKGDSETHPLLSPTDPFADFETWDEGNFATPREPKQPEMLQYEYARPALKLGLQLHSRLGANPFRFGMIGSTDSHIAMPAVEEDNFLGKFATDEPSPRRNTESPMRVYRYAASGYAAVWARENTREAIFEAMQRREVYASTGPRMTVRFFGSWEFGPEDHLAADIATIGYRKGVPMGALLPERNQPGAPSFLLAASRDPQGAALQRIQVIKGWVDAQGHSHERVFDLAVAAGEGAAQLGATWQDPAFDPGQPAFYYARVLEVPTPRWTHYDEKRFGVSPPPGTPKTLQERAYTSPIWYTPKEEGLTDDET